MIRKDFKSQPRTQPTLVRWRSILGLLCLALVVVGSTIQVAHTHPGGEVSHPDCSLCATAHVVAQAAGSPEILQTALTVAAAPAVTPILRQSTPSVFALFTRPPPAASTAV